MFKSYEILTFILNNIIFQNNLARFVYIHLLRFFSTHTFRLHKKKTMENNQNYVDVHKVKPHKDTWKVHVKLFHWWTSNTSFGEETLECVLADEIVSHHLTKLSRYVLSVGTILIIVNFVCLGWQNTRKLQNKSDVSPETKSLNWWMEIRWTLQGCCFWWYNYEIQSLNNKQ